MTLITKRFFLLCCLMSFFAVIIGIFVRSSYKGYRTVDEVAEKGGLENYTVQSEDLTHEDLFVDVTNIDELKSNSEFIAKVKVCNERKLYANTIKTKLEIEEVLKDNSNTFSKNDTIYLYELVSIDDRFQIINSVAWNQLMETGEEYYVFLNPLKTAKEYIKSKEEEMTFLPSTPCYSIIPVLSKEALVLEQEKLDNGEYCYKDVMGMYLLTTDENVMARFLDFKTKLTED